MNMMRRCLLVAATVLMGVVCHAQGQERAVDSQTSTSSTNATIWFGKVTDVAGTPVVGASVEYWCFANEGVPEYGPQIAQKVETGVDGSFRIQETARDGWLLANKSGLAPSWIYLNKRIKRDPNTELRLVLTSPGTVSGTVVDEAKQPLADTEVWVSLAYLITETNGTKQFQHLTGKPLHDRFAARTDVGGRFAISGFPTNAVAQLAALHPGKVMSSMKDEESSWNLENDGYRAGQENIQLTMKPSGNIEGRVLTGDTQQPVSQARMLLLNVQGGYAMPFENEITPSGPDGAFRINDVPEGSFELRAVIGKPNSTEWVAESVPVSVEAGQTTRDVKIIAIHGGVLEVMTVAKSDRKPVSDVNVSANGGKNNVSMVTDATGLARLRLVPGEYSLLFNHESRPMQQTTVQIENGKTNRIEIEMAEAVKIRGTVRKPDGQPAPGLPIRLIGGNYSPDVSYKTDTNGVFELSLNPNGYRQQGNESMCLFVRDAENNLAVAQEVDEDTGALDLKLVPGLTLAGRVVSEEKSLTNINVTLVFWTGRMGIWLKDMVRILPEGRFEIPALPLGRKYGIIVRAPGYGQKQNHNITETDTSRLELDPIELRPATLKLAGVVLNQDEKPVAKANVHLYGNDQPDGNVQTDPEGRFAFDAVCEGRIQLSANKGNMHGSVGAEGGDTNVIVRLGQSSNMGEQTKVNKLLGTVVDAAGKPVEGAQLAVFPPRNEVRWFKTDTNGTFKLSWSLEPWQGQSGAILVVRDMAHEVGAIEEISEDITNLNVILKPAVTLTGVVKDPAGTPLAETQIGLQLKGGNSYNWYEEKRISTSAEGRYEIKGVPVGGTFMVCASRKGYGERQQEAVTEPENMHVELEPVVLKVVDRIVAGQVLDDKEKPVSGANVFLNGDGQPSGSVTTDSKGHFQFKVCEGHVSLNANSQSGYGQATAEAGDTNIVINLRSYSNPSSETPRRQTLKGQKLPDMSTVHLGPEAAPDGKPVLVCLFDAGQRPSRYIMRQLNEQAAALQSKGICLVCVQAVVITDDVFNEWKTTSQVKLPIGRVTEASDSTKWATKASALPWFILANGAHQVVEEGFAFEELEAQIQKVAK